MKLIQPSIPPVVVLSALILKSIKSWPAALTKHPAKAALGLDEGVVSFASFS
jgi:hypothetical protein